MRLSTFSDYSMRVLMHTALRHPARVTIDEVAEAFGISRHHLVKVVHSLGRAGYLVTYRGIGGGFNLARSPQEIGLRDVIRLSEETESVMDCRENGERVCRIFPACRLKGVLDEAAQAFFAVLERYTLADLVEQPSKLNRALGLDR